MTKWITIILSIAGLAVGVYVVATSGEKPPNQPPAAPPSVNPFRNGIAATGTIEARSRNIAIGSPVGAIVIAVPVEVNQTVKAGDELFRLDTRELEAQLLRAAAALDVSRAQLTRLEAQPRQEDLPPLVAAVDRAKARLADVEDWHRTLTAAHRDEAVSSNEVTRARFSLDLARSELAAAQATLDQAKAGAWAPDLRIARSSVEQAQADVDAVRLLIERMTVRSPISGVILKRNVDPGRFAPADPTSAAIMVGDLSALRVRAQIDEEDAPRLREGATAVARVRGASEQGIPLTMIRIEPLASPKSSLTGSVTERVDTRVIEVLFELGPGAAARLFPGQVVDVYVDVKPVTSK